MRAGFRRGFATFTGLSLCLALSLSATSCVSSAAVPDEDENELTNASGCGVFRWAVKTGTDAQANLVNMTPVDTTQAALVALPKPATLPATRISPTELQVVRLTNVTLTQYKVESDSDYHLGIVTGSTQMEAEIPSTNCAGTSGAFAAAIKSARAAFDAKFTATGSYQNANIPVTITGVSFFDMPAHGANGAPNGIEIHPVLSICFGLDCAGATPPPPPPPPQQDFSLSAAPQAVTGATASSTISSAATGGFSSSIALSVSGAPAGATASLGAASIPASGSAALSLNAGSAAPGTYSIVVTGTSGSLSHAATVAWTIAGGGGGGGGGGGNVIVNGGFESALTGWTAAGTAANSAIAHGGSSAAQLGSTTSKLASSLSQTFTVPAGGGPLSFWYQGFCNDTVRYASASATLKDNTAGTTATLLPATCTKTGKWVQVTSGALTAGHSLTLTLANKGDVYKTFYNYTLFDDVQLAGGAATPDFSLSANPGSVSTAQGATGTSTVAVAGTGGFSGSVALSVSGVPSGATSSLSVASVAAGGSATLSLSAGTAAAGTYAVTVTGTSGALSHTAQVSWTITGATPGADFTLSLDTSAVTSTGSAAATANATVTPSGSFKGGVALSVSGLPSGASASFNPATVTGLGTSSLTLTPGSAAAGTYALTVTGSGSGIAHAASLSWTLASGTTPGSIKTVFIILMENHNWSSIKGSPSAPYINNTLLPMGAHAEAYNNVPGIHPSEPNYIWLEAGTNFGILNDSAPSANHQSTTQHLTTLLSAAGHSWKAYEEGISGTSCPLTTSGLYAPKHLGMLFFDDVTNTNSASSQNCIQHVRPYTQLASDLSASTVADYNFITPDMCHDGHNSSGCATSDAVKNTDDWLAAEMPKLLASPVYRAGNAAVIVTWDESEQGDHPIGMIVISPKAKAGYSNTIPYSHSSTLRTLQEIFNVTPLLGDAANATDLSDLFQKFP